MKLAPVREVYPGREDELGFDPVRDYGPLLESLGYEIVLRADDADPRGSSGDSRVLYRADANRYGVLIFGWGSCAGCDALQACRSYEEIEELRRSLLEQIIWGTPEELLQWANSEGRETDHDAKAPAKQKFLGDLKEKLELAIAKRDWRKPDFLARGGSKDTPAAQNSDADEILYS